mgnify:FL=1
MKKIDQEYGNVGVDLSQEASDKRLRQAQLIRRKRGRNPKFASRGLVSNVRTQIGGPGQNEDIQISSDQKKNVGRKFLAGELPRLSQTQSQKALETKVGTTIKTRKLPTVQQEEPVDDGTGNPNEYGGPEEDLEEVAGQLGKASKLHGNQSKRVAKIAKGMKGEVGNPYMKRSKSKYGM